MAMWPPWLLLLAASVQLGDPSGIFSHGAVTVFESSEGARAVPRRGYSDVGEVVADFCQGQFKTTLVHDEYGVTMAALLLRLLHGAGCAANLVVESGGSGANCSGDNCFSWTRDPHHRYKVLLANASYSAVSGLLQPLTPLKAQVGSVCHLSLPDASALKFEEPLVPFRSLKCCRMLNIGLGPPVDVPEDLAALEQRAGGVTLMLYAAEGLTRTCTYCGFMRRLDDRFEYLPGVSGAHLVVSAVNNTPYVVVGRPGPDDEYRLQEGVELKLLKAISRKLNFTYSLNVDQTAEYGALKNGTWTGLIGDVLYREPRIPPPVFALLKALLVRQHTQGAVSAASFTDGAQERDSHMAMSEISFTQQRIEVIAYLYPVVFDVLAYITKAPRVIPFALAIVRPLSETMWGYLVLALVVSSAFLFCLRWSPVDRGRRDRPDFWFLLSTLSRQNPWEEEHASAGYRVFLVPWWLFVLVLTTWYSGRLVAIMSVAVFEPWLSDLDRLEDALARRELLLCTHSKTIFIEYIKVATSGVLYQARVNQLEGGRSDTLLVSDRKTGLERTLYKSFVYVDSRMSLVTGMELLSEPETRRLRVVDDYLGIEYCGFVFQKGCPLRRAVNARSRALFETGHMHHWTEETFVVSLPEHLRPEHLVNYHTDPTKKARERVALTMRDFVGPTWLLGVGYALGFAALMLELAATTAKRFWGRGVRQRRRPARRTRTTRQLPRRPGQDGIDTLVVGAATSVHRPCQHRGQRADQLRLRHAEFGAAPRLICQRDE